MLLATLYSPGCCKSQFLAQQHVDLSLEVPGGDANVQLRNAYSFLPPSLRGAEALNMEFGVREGGSINMLARHTGTDTRWDGFDSFQGLPSDVGAARISGWGGGRFSTKGKLPTVPDHVHLHVGWFNETLPPFLDDQLSTGRHMVGFMNMDADLYVSTIAVFDAVFSRCMHRNGTVISFDELFGTHQILAHEWRALTCVDTHAMLQPCRTYVQYSTEYAYRPRACRCTYLRRRAACLEDHHCTIDTRMPASIRRYRGTTGITHTSLRTVYRGTTGANRGGPPLPLQLSVHLFCENPQQPLRPGRRADQQLQRAVSTMLRTLP